MHLIIPFDVHAFGICVEIELTFFCFYFGVFSLRMDDASDRNYLSPFVKRYPATSSSGKNFRSLVFHDSFCKRIHTLTHAWLLL